MKTVENIYNYVPVKCILECPRTSSNYLNAKKTQNIKFLLSEMVKQQHK